ncbi:MAG TPA: type I-E CRISPR-associated protein Cse1/CasA [Desulfobacteraceae bacterium]|nr:type I-E CRISPR-associated protein Cse1/CasA [Desulfobacteraceae bacterium]HPJ67868.1 type I-E CRISPR-associated protein Cse1/CasA [Desulfobacteraceae bacterium]HPQ28243.1 type I-E CRISPR-associated protein Cse1/CasA [Desulfobacteraceae bacterium]
MNLITDRWLPVIRASGKLDKAAPSQIAEKDDPIIELNAPRPDFQGALYQFLIGLLQTCYAPVDHDEWLEYWENQPDEKELEEIFIAVAPAFELFNKSGPAFMQDIALKNGEIKKISSLLIEAPGEKTIKDNLDHFVKRNTVNRLCQSCTAMALFTLQINAPSGGVGHRVGLRGGGPLTTLVMPDERKALWHKVWLNVLYDEESFKSITRPSPDIFPWMENVRISGKGGVDTRPEDTHPLQVYWSMPRRIKLVPSNDAYGTCDLCGMQIDVATKEYATLNYGVNYVGEWVHPLTPYRFDPQKEKPPLSLKGQKGGLGYRHWISLTLAHSDNGDCAAKVATTYMSERARDIGSQKIARLWCSGYDMDNMKARCWYDHKLPLFYLEMEQKENVLSWSNDLINSAWDVVRNLSQQVKAAWFRRPGDIKGDMSAVTLEFWQRSESDFYNLLTRLAELPGDLRMPPPEIYAIWVKKIQALAYKLFDEWVLEGPAEDMDMQRITAARRELKKKLNNSKQMKDLIIKANLGKGVKNGSAALPIP